MKTALIIEDEIPAAEHLSRILSANRIDVLGVARSNREAVAWLNRQPHPDLIFADIALADGNSFEALARTKPQSAIIFTTAFDKYALEAFSRGGIDYLLKPITAEKLGQTLDRLNQKRRLFNPRPVTTGKSFLVASGNVLRRIKACEAVQFVSEQNTTFIVTQGRQFPIAKSLDGLMAELDQEQFFRISRKCIVHRESVESVSVFREVKFIGGHSPQLISRSRYSDFLKWLIKKAP